MTDLIGKFEPLVVQVLHGDREVTLPVIPGSAEALMVWALQGRGRSVVLIADGPQSLETKHRDLGTLAPEARRAALLYYPAAEAFGAAPAAADPEIAGLRLGVLATLAGMAGEGRAPGRAWLVATCVQALTQYTVPLDRLQERSVSIAVGAEMERDVLSAALVRAGYAFESEVVEKGRACVKGGLVDVWPLNEPWPIRIEFSGSAIESLRAFDPESQRSVSRRTEVLLLPADERSGAPGDPAAKAVSVLGYLPDDAVFVWSDMGSIRYHAGLQEELLDESGAAGGGLSLQQLRAAVARRSAKQVVLHTESDGSQPVARLDAEPLPGILSVPREALQPDLAERARQRLLADLQSRAAAGQTVVFFFDSEGSLSRFRETRAARPEGAAGPALRVGVLSGGFLSDAAGLAVVAEGDLYGRRKAADRRYDPSGDRPRGVRHAGMRIADLTDIEPGDLVVHVEHGLGRYRGLNEIIFSGQRQEVLTVEYAEGAKLHVPVSQTHLLSRYVGLSRRRVQLHRLGGKRWDRDKAAAERAIVDLATLLLETQAQRRLLAGHAFPPDTPWQREFEAAFPYRETPDQMTAIEEVKRDMESPRPMDRLVCGDAGYGKTEVALRAAFKAVMNAKQVAVLVPTTVLAQQHLETFAARLAAYPVRVEVLSRFCGRRRQTEILRGMAEGTVDIVIGTHALFQPGVRFKDLGVVIIDEEQRFGVRHKEQLKQMRRLVDVLTLTATPIPRTLYMSLTGARDMSLLQTPPRERMAIETVVTRNADRVVREAVLREINREGQIYYLHNRIMTIERVRERLEQLVPEARTRVAHGRMSTSELAGVMHDFAAGAFDVLLCTTIVESGLDIPLANTILIDRADRFGIADLYQLRGRVGRSNRKAYAYLLLPAHGVLDADARERIAAVRKHSSLSAGFSLALRDLELRGAGNLLGAQQSGHITAVGFGLYCQLLQRTVAGLKGEPLPPVIEVEARLDFLDLSPQAESAANGAFIPYGYIEDERLRVAAYRRLAETATPAALAELAADLADRYGSPPPPVRRLLKIVELRLAAAAQGLREVETQGGKIMLKDVQGYRMEGARFPRLRAAAADEQLDELIAVVRHAGMRPGACEAGAPIAKHACSLCEG